MQVCTSAEKNIILIVMAWPSCGACAEYMLTLLLVCYTSDLCVTLLTYVFVDSLHMHPTSPSGHAAYTMLQGTVIQPQQ